MTRFLLLAITCVALTACVTTGSTVTTASVGSDLEKIASAAQLGVAVLDVSDPSLLNAKVTGDINTAAAALQTAGAALATSTAPSGASVQQDIQTAYNAALALEQAYIAAEPTQAAKAAAYLSAVKAAIAFYDAEASAVGLPVVTV